MKKVEKVVLQILTVERLLAGVERLDMPPSVTTFKTAPKEKSAPAEQKPLI